MTGGAVRSVFRFFLIVLATPVALLAQGGQTTAVPSGQGPVTPLAPDAMFTVAVAMAVVEAAPRSSRKL
jgi:hypothetical protein